MVQVAPCARCRVVPCSGTSANDETAGAETAGLLQKKERKKKGHAPTRRRRYRHGHTTPNRPTPSYLTPLTPHAARTHSIPEDLPAQATHIPSLKPQTESYVHQPELPGTPRHRWLSEDSGTQH